MKTRLRLLRALLAICAAFAMHTLRADDYVWLGATSGDFNTAGWKDIDTGLYPAGPPGSGDIAEIPSGVTLSCSGGSVDELFCEGAIDLTGSLTATSVGGVNLTGTGNLIAGNNDPMDPAQDGTGNGPFIVTGAHLTLSNASGGLFYVNGGGSIIIQSGLPGGGGSVSDASSLLEVDGAATNFYATASDGAISLGSITNNEPEEESGATGAGAVFSVIGSAEFDSNPIVANAGGQVTIGGNLALRTSTLYAAAAPGLATLTGPGSSMTVGGTLSVAPSSAGVQAGGVSVLDGAFLHANVLTLDGMANLTLADGGLAQIDAGLSAGGTSSGAVSITGGSGLTQNGGALGIGFSSGSKGSVSISGMNEDGQTVGGSYLHTNNTEVAAGYDAGSTGDLELDTSAAMAVNGGTTFAVGSSGTGTMEVRSGSAVAITNVATAFEVGQFAGSEGTVTIESSSPNAMTVAGPAVIGDQGTGHLYVAGTGAAGGDASGNFTANGNFFVGGNGSPAASSGNGFVEVSSGALTVTGGPAVNIGLGNGKGAVGEIYVTGTGSSLKLGGATIAGVGGDGELAAANGAAATTSGLELGSAAGASGALLVYNSGTVWTETNALYVGGLPGQAGGQGGVAVNDGGLLRVYKKLYIPSTGVVTVTKLLTASADFPDPAPPATSTPDGRVFVGSDNAGPDGAVRVGTGGLLSGKGKQSGTRVIHTNVFGNVVIGLGGKFQPGGDPDVFSIDGDCDLSDAGAGGGETDIEVAGTGAAGTDYDQLIASGKVTLGGKLRLVLLEGYKPQVGDTFNPVKAGTMAGEFTSVEAPGLTLSRVSGSGKLTVKVMSVADVAAPVITSDKTARGKVGEDFTYQIEATGLPAGYAATNLPAGLDIDDSTGLISGIPTAPGTFSVQLASTSVGGTGSEILKLTIAGQADAPPVITVSPAQVDASPKANFSYQVSASNAPTSYAATGLPAGLSLNVTTGVISGKATPAGTYPIALSATNAYGTGAASLTLVVELPAVKLVATVPETVAGGGKAGKFTVSIPFALPSGLKVGYSVQGSAAPGVDYVRIKDFAEIKAGTTSSVIKVEPIGDLGGAAEKIVSLKLKKGADYTIKTPKAEKVKILAAK